MRIETSFFIKTLSYAKLCWFCLVLLQTPVAELEEDDSLFKKLEIEVKGHDTAVLNSYEKFVRMTAKELEINLSKV